MSGGGRVSLIASVSLYLYSQRFLTLWSPRTAVKTRRMHRIEVRAAQDVRLVVGAPSATTRDHQTSMSHAQLSADGRHGPSVELRFSFSFFHFPCRRINESHAGRQLRCKEIDCRLLSPETVEWISPLTAISDDCDPNLVASAAN